MSKKLISVGIAIVSGTALAWGAASCSSDNSNNDGGTGSSSSSSGSGSGSSSSSSGSGSSSSSSGSGSGSSSGSSSSGGSSGDAGGGFVKIDDMEGTGNGPIELMPPAPAHPGYWYDGVGPGGHTPANVLLAPNDGGAYTYTPIPNGPVMTMPGVMSTQAAHVACTLWSQYAYCQQAFEFAQVDVGDGGTAAAGDAASDAAPAPTPRVTIPFDASMYTGVTFWVMGGQNATAGSSAGGILRVLFPDKDTDPRGGRCGPITVAGCTTCTGDAGACYDSYQAPVPAAMVTTMWQQVTVQFASLSGQTFGFEGTAFDPTSLYGITFQVGGPNVVDASAPVNADFWIDDLYFTK